MKDMTFLVVEDSTTMRRMICNILKDLDVSSIIEAGNGEDALAKMYINDVHFVITDWNMPKMDGLNLVKEIKKEPGFSNIPILMVTSKGFKDDIISAMKAGVNSYIIKPFSPNILEAKLRNILETN